MANLRGVYDDTYSSCKDDVTWIKPSEGYIKKNFDGSKLVNKDAALGFTIRDSNGKVLILGARACCKVSVLIADKPALKECYIAAKDMGVSNIVIEGGNLCVINSIRETWKIPYDISLLIVDINIELSSFKDVKFVHCYREAKKVADFRANVGHSCPNLSRWVDSH